MNGIGRRHLQINGRRVRGIAYRRNMKLIGGHDSDRGMAIFPPELVLEITTTSSAPVCLGMLSVAWIARAVVRKSHEDQQDRNDRP